FTVWMAIRAHGWRAIREAVRRNIALTRLLEQLLADRGFTILPDGKLSIACARWQPPDLDGPSCDLLQEELTRRLVASGKTWFHTVRHAGRSWLRFNMVNLHTREEHIRRLVDLVHESARALTPG